MASLAGVAAPARQAELAARCGRGARGPRWQRQTRGRTPWWWPCPCPRLPPWRLETVAWCRQ
eukprot:4404736-Lingulodinium_polyedra.AAC.1